MGVGASLLFSRESEESGPAEFGPIRRTRYPVAVQRRAFLAGLPLLAALPSVARAAPGGPPGSASSGPLVVGQSPPPLALSRLSGTDEVTLDGLAGRVVLLDFWATWCRPCLALMPMLDAMHGRYHGRGLSIVGLSPEPEALIRGHLGAHPVAYTIARDVGGTIRAYGVRGIPMLVAIDRAGKVREVMIGIDDQSFGQLDTLVQRMLAERV